MIARFRFIPLSIVIVSGTALALVVAIMLFSFSSYCSHLQRAARALADDAAFTIDRAANERNIDAVAAGNLFLSRSFRPDLMIVFIDETRRVTIFHEFDKNGAMSVHMSVRPRFDRSGDPQASDVASRAVIGLGTVFGLQVSRTHARDIEIDAGSNPPIFAGTVKEYVRLGLFGIFVIVAITLVSGRVLAIQSRRQLTEVTSALEHLAIGDFTPQFVAEGKDGRLARLAVAYNGAVEAVQRAFSERDKAHSSMQLFISDAAHQLRTPLTVIRGYIGVLRQGDSDGSLTPTIDAMRKQCVLIGTLIDRLLLLQKWEESVTVLPQGVDVGALVTDIVLPIVQSHPQRSITLDSHGGSIAHIDPGDFRHAVTNIVENAIKYTEGPIEVAVASNNGNVAVTISDHGPGISPAHAERVFDRFFRGNRRDVEGSGLGLAIAKRAVERAGGTLSVVTATESGSHFSISLPREAQS